MDNTIEDLLEAWLAYLNKKYNKTVLKSSIITWSMQDHYPDLTWEQIFEPLTTRNFWKTVKPFEDAIHYINKLISEHQDIYIVTSARYDTVQYKIEEVLLKYFPMIDYHKVVILYNKQLFNCDIMIDDNIDNLSNTANYNLLYDMPYNQILTEEQAKNIKRVTSWKEIYNFIHNLDFFFTKENKKVLDY